MLLFWLLMNEKTSSKVEGRGKKMIFWVSKWKLSNHMQTNIQTKWKIFIENLNEVGFAISMGSNCSGSNCSGRMKIIAFVWVFIYHTYTYTYLHTWRNELCIKICFVFFVYEIIWNPRWYRIKTTELFCLWSVLFCVLFGWRYKLNWEVERMIDGRKRLSDYCDVLQFNEICF